MNIYGHDTDRVHQLQRQLHDAEQFRALVAEMRTLQRRIKRMRKAGDKPNRETTDIRGRLEDAVDRELRLLESD